MNADHETFDVSESDGVIVAKVGGNIHSRPAGSDEEPGVSKTVYVVTLTIAHGELKVLAIDRRDSRE
jgi:hypothetical protein